jgi:hypothetical protein
MSMLACLIASLGAFTPQEPPAKLPVAPAPVQSGAVHTPGHGAPLPKPPAKKTVKKTPHIHTEEEAKKHLKEREAPKPATPKKPYLKKHTGHGGAPAPKGPTHPETPKK